MILFLNSFLIYYLVTKIFQKKYLSFFVAFFYSVSSAQVSPLYYLAGGIQVLGATLFILLSLIFWREYLYNKKNKYLLLTFISFILALGSHELSVVIPLLIFGLSVALLSFKKALSFYKDFLLFLFFTVIYLYIELTLIGYSSNEQQYQTVLNMRTVANSYMWYTGWALGLPEMLIDFVLPSFKLNPDLMRYWGDYYKVIFSSFYISLFIIIFSFIFVALKNKTFFMGKIIFFVFWFFVSLLPIIILPSHKSTQYLETGLAAFWTVIGLLIFKTHSLIKNKFFARMYILIFIFTLFVLSSTSIYLQRTTYWATERGKYSKQLINQVKNIYPTLPKGSIIYFENDPSYPFIAEDWGGSSKQANIILNGSDALQLLYNDPTLKVFYEDLGDLPSDVPKENVFKATAKIF